MRLLLPWILSEFVYLRVFPGKLNPPEKPSRRLSLYQTTDFLSLTDTSTHISRNTYRPENYYILCYNILCYFCVLQFALRMLLHFALLLHFVAKFIT